MAKRPEQTARTKADFQEAFWQLYACEPIEHITVARVCERAGYNRATFYLHFHDMYELLESIEAPLLEGMAACVEKCMKRLSDNSSKASCLIALGEVIVFYERNREKIIVLLGECGDSSFIRRLKSELKPLWRTYLVAEDCEYSQGEIDLLLEYTISGSLFMISDWLLHPNGVSAAQMGHLIYDTAIRDFSARVK